MNQTNNQHIQTDENGKVYIDGVEVRIKKVAFEDTKSMNTAYKDLKNSFDLGVISAEEFYNELEFLRNYYLEEGSAAWWKYTKMIINYENSLAEAQAKINSQLAEQKMDKLSGMYTAGLISAEEYYDQLSKLRNDYFEEGSKQWEDFSIELAKFYSKQIERNDKSAENLTDRLSSGIMQLVRIKGMDGKIQDEVYRLSTPDLETANKYFEGFNYLKDNGAPHFILDKYLSMSTHDALNLFESMARMGNSLPNYFSNLTASRNEIKAMADQIYGSDILQKAINEIIQSLANEGLFNDIEITQNFYGSEISPAAAASETMNSLKLQGVGI